MNEEELKQKTRAILEEVAERNETIFFDDLCDELEVSSEEKELRLRKILGSLSAEERKERGMVSVVVVYRKTGLPSDGFFNLANEWGLMGSEESKENFFGRELNRVHGADWGAE